MAQASNESHLHPYHAFLREFYHLFLTIISRQITPNRHIRPFFKFIQQRTFQLNSIPSGTWTSKHRRTTPWLNRIESYNMYVQCNVHRHIKHWPNQTNGNRKIPCTHRDVADRNAQSSNENKINTKLQVKPRSSTVNAWTYWSFNYFGSVRRGDKANGAFIQSLELLCRVIKKNITALLAVLLWASRLCVVPPVWRTSRIADFKCSVLFSNPPF